MGTGDRLKWMVVHYNMTILPFHPCGGRPHVHREKDKCISTDRPHGNRLESVLSVLYINESSVRLHAVGGAMVAVLCWYNVLPCSVDFTQLVPFVRRFANRSIGPCAGVGCESCRSLLVSSAGAGPA